MRLVQYPLFLVLQLAAYLAYAQPGNLKFAHIGTEAGLSQNNVTCILRDRQGFMWFGTRDGLNRYDGYDFDVYKNIPEDSLSLSSNFVTSIMQDRKGNIWVGTWGGGVDRFDVGKRRFIRYGGVVHSDFINSLMEDSEGRIWIGSNDHGVWVYDPQTGKVALLTSTATDPGSLSDNDVQTILEDHEHRIWIGTSHGGLNLYDPTTHSFRIFEHHDGDPGSLACNTIARLFEDGQHRLWIGMRDGGLDLYDAQHRTFRHFRNDPGNPNSLAKNVVLSLANDDKGNLWIGTENGGISILDPDLKTFRTYAHDDIDNTSLTNNSIYSLYPDLYGNMWVGTYDGGINLFSRSANTFAHYKHSTSAESLSNNYVLDILEDKDHLWVGTDGGGLDEMDCKTGKFTHFFPGAPDGRSIGGSNVLSLYDDEAGNLWAGTWGNGITVIGKNGKVVKQYKHSDTDSTSLGGNNVYSIIDDGEGIVWVATYGDGLSQFNTKTGGFHHYKHVATDPNSPGSDRLHTLLSDSNGILWIGTFDGGLDRLDEYTGIFKHFVHEPGKNSLSNNTVNYVYADSRHNLWICTADGLNCLDRKTGHFTLYGIKDGLPSSVIFGILEDKNRKLWVSTNNGLSRFDPETRQFKNFSVADGLQSNQFKAHACYKSPSGALYFGGVNGFSKFYPDSIRDNPFDPPLLITGFSIFNKDVPIGDSAHPTPLSQDITMTKNIRIPYNSSVISFEFGSLNYTVPEKKHYAYRLDGFDDAWNDVGTKRTATYTNLDPGTYTFQVKGWDNDGNWSPTVASLTLTVTPPFWQTWWFRLLATIQIAGAIILVFRLRLHTVKTQKKKLEAEVDQRTNQLALSRDEERRAREQAEKASRAKSEFMANISHELRTPMNAIIGFTDLVLTTELQRPQREYLQNVHRSGYNLLGIINDILDYSKLEAGKLTIENTAFKLCQLVEQTVDTLAIKAFEKKLELICETDPLLPIQVMGDPGRIQQILVNLLGNAIKFTEKGEVVVSLERGSVIQGSDGRRLQPVTLSVKDTGIGIPKEKVDHIFESFTQADSTTTRKYGGTGLGLTIARNLAEMMDGSLEVKSEPGKGSTFTLRLTLEIMDEMSTVPAIQRPVLKRVLVVDDNITNCHLLENIFHYMSVECTTCTSGPRALEILSGMRDEEAFDLIVTDHQMPIMDGVTLVGKIKELLAGRRQPFILMLSSLDKEMCVEDAEQLGIDMFLSKPVKLPELNNILQAVFGPAQESRTGAEAKPEIHKLTDHAKILVAEDEPVNMLLISEVLGKMGFQVIKASNGKQVLELLADHHPAVILMDVNMPEMDGLEATQIIRALPQPQRNIPIVALTAGAMSEDRERCLGAGMNSFISKPFRLEEIEGVLKKYVKVA
ncbi:MAG TPA: two-component regulator propeller domain-containing protein [Puia sp.]|jgi:signal transduction histidine kinase/CheY-like chemotaxis protein/ligand-binding sensor domain-containing protein|nr:two-component regulator propeller domain-containing protein [Puia sp.]